MMKKEAQILQLDNYTVSATDIADILWLASFLTSSETSASLVDNQVAEAQSSVEETLAQDAVEDISRPTIEPPDSMLDDESEQLGRIYADKAQQEANFDNEWGGIPVQVPMASAILDKQALIRSLRPLQRRVNSPKEWMLHEEETADQVATAILADDFWLPVQYPARERWLDLVVLVDGSPSMAVWEQTTDEMIALLTNIGIFRDVVRWTLALVEGENGVNDVAQTTLRLQPATVIGKAAGLNWEATHLLDAQQRRLFLVISDCSSVVWDNGAAQQLLQPLAQHNLVSLLQLLPEGLWESSGLGLATTVRLTSSQPLTSNTQLKGLARREAEQPIPVVSLEATALGRWARFMVGREPQAVTGYYLATKTNSVEVETLQLLQELDIESVSTYPILELSDSNIEAVYAAFRQRVPRHARPLAAYWAAAPLTLPVMRLVQAALMPESTHADFVYVFYSGLLRRTTAKTEMNTQIVYDFVGGEAMRQHLLTLLPRYEVEQVAELVIAELSRYLQAHIDQHASFTALLGMPGITSVLRLDPTARHFAKVTSQVLHYLGGIYESLANRLERLVKTRELRVPVVDDDEERQNEQLLTSAGLRILIVDDDPRWQETYRRTLERWGWVPIIATGYGEDLQIDAINKLNRFHCQIALVGMDLLDKQGQDQSGLKLIPHLKPATAIVVTAYPSRKAMGESLREYGAFSFVGKDEGPNALKEIIDEAITAHWWFLNEPDKYVVRWPNDIDADRLTLRFRDKLVNIGSGEIEVCLRKHFKNALQINITHWDDTNRSNQITFAPRGRSAIFKVTATIKQNGSVVTLHPTLIKFARRERIHRELEDYKTYIDGLMATRNVARLRASTLMWHIGLVEYDYLNERGNPIASMSTFTEYYEQGANESIDKTLQTLFGDVWGNLYRNRKEQTKTLFQSYNDVWKSNPRDRDDDLEVRLKLVQNKEREVRFSDYPFSLPNPVQWILRRVGSSMGRDTSPPEFSSKLAITHGDMHADNILVDYDGEPNLIDFERTGYGPILQDFVHLEADVLLRVAHKIPTEEFIVLVKTLLDSRATGNKSPSLSEMSHETQKACQFAFTLYNLAKEQTADRNFINYMWGLLLNVAFRLTLLNKRDKGIAAARMRKERELERAYLYGGLLCLRLEQPTNNDWLSDEISKYIERMGKNVRSTLTNPAILRNLLKQHFSLSEVQTLCAELDIAYETISGDNLEGKIRELVSYSERRGRRDELVAYCRRVRPNVEWSKLAKSDRS